MFFFCNYAHNIFLWITILTTTSTCRDKDWSQAQALATTSTSSTKNTNQQKKKKKKIQLVLLDRDGVINEDVGSPGVLDAQQLQLIPSAGHAMGDLQRAHLKIAIITNQSCVGKNLLAATQLDEIMRHLGIMVQQEDSDATWDAVFVCTTTTTKEDHRRKPNPGMILEACQKFQVDPTDCVFVGDSLTDMQAAYRAGVPTRILVATGYGTTVMMMEHQSQQSNNNNNNNAEETTTRSDPTTIFHPKEEENTLHSVMPVVYLPNIHEASKWIIQHNNNV
jgi:D-glycero-D-manno-heptose 1,7-bisphosphate phosphatase